MNFNMTIELSDLDIKQAIVDSIRKQIPDTHRVSANDVTFVIHENTDMRGERMGSSLKQAKIAVRRKPDSVDYRDR